MNQQGDSNDVVISGISGVFPNSDNVEEFKENLFSGNDMISSASRCKTEGVKIGMLKTIDRFDYSFFHITHVQAQGMLISSRILLEKTFEAILDAGYNPQEIKGKNIAVICGIWDTIDEGDPARDRKAPDYIEAFSRMQFMMANRISNWLDVHGPSYPINTACSASLYAIDHAIKAIQRGQCEGAIVCGSNFCFSKVEYLKDNPLFSSTGTCSPFDVDANGYVKSEAVVACFLQTRKDARRIYANLIHSTTNSDGFREEGTGFPSVKQQKKLYEQFYKEINMDPRTISYIEAHGTGTQVGDVVEGTSIDEFFCVGRKTPLKIGALKSNMGHAEAAAALCSIIKLIVAFESGTIPANLRYNKPNPKIKGLFNGHLEVVSKPTPLPGQYFALNSFGVGGSNGHVVLSPHTKVKNQDSLFGKRIPYLVTASGRTEEAIDCILNNVQKNHNDAEYIRLLQEIFKYDINGHPHRGYIILQENKKCDISKKFFSGEKRPIWFVFSGMGSQWPAMGKLLMEIPLFAESIQRSHQVLQSKGLDLMKIITHDDPEIFENILNTFVGIAAIQIALVDILKKLNITPDGIIGHSVGELGCAYVDGCFTAEQMILAAYYRGLVSVETDLIHGTMVAIGQNYESMKDYIPPEIDIACHNGPTSCTLSGPTEIMQDYIKKLNEKKIFVRAVKTSNIAYHSRYIASAGPKFISYLKTVIPEPKLRSNKWICTSSVEHKWNSDEVKYSSAEYHTNNLLNPVYFEESYKYIPNNAIIVEIAPRGLLGAILKRSLPTTVDIISLTTRNHENNAEYLLNSFGQLYELGCDMELSHLYPPVEFPVSKSTPMISPLIKWRHDEQWQIDDVHSNFSQSNEKKFLFNPKSESNEYLRGHMIDGRNLYPGFGYLWLIMETVATIENKKVTEVDVAFESVRFESALTIPTKDPVNFLVSVQQLNGHFELKGNNVTLVTGKVRVLENACNEMVDVAPYKNEIPKSDILPMNKNDFYKELRLRGYHYEGLFKKVEYFNFDGKYAEISWCNNFVSFMDAMGQTTLLLEDYRDLSVFTYIDKLVIDFDKQFKTLESLDKENPKFSVNFYPYHDLICSGGIQMSGWKCKEIARQKNNSDPILEKYQFVPYISDEKMNLSSTIRICIQIALKSILPVKATIYEILEQDYNSKTEYISYAVINALKYLPFNEAYVKLLINSETVPETDEQSGVIISNEKLPKDKSATLIILSNIENKITQLNPLLRALRDDGFIILKESINKRISFENFGFNLCFSRKINDSEKIILLNKKSEPKPIRQAIQLKNASYSWIPKLQNALQTFDSNNGENLVIYSEKEPTNGILGFFHSLKKEEREKNITCFSIMDNNAPPFSLDDPFYKSQYDKNLCYNIYTNGKWGSFWHLDIDSEKDMECIHAFCMLEERGNLSSFRWVEGSLNPTTDENSNRKSLVHVYYSGLNFKVVMMSVGKISISDTTSASSRLIECNQGGEFSGKDANGIRVMGMVEENGISTMVESKSYLTWKVPDNMTLEEAASIPVVYSTVIYAFFFKMKLEEGCSILIHSGSGGIGQAAINICLHYKCNIFTTVGTPEKVKFIRKTFPQIPESHIGNSRDTSFLKMIQEQTNGKGVDVVLNSLAGDRLLASVKCVAKCGHFLEIGKFDMANNNSLDLGPFLNNITFHSVQLDVLILNDFTETNNKISNKLQEMLDQGIIKPINRTVYQKNEVESAVRSMASGKHIGKLVIKIRDEEQDFKTKPTLLHFKAKPRILCQENKSYVILGGLGGFGIELADWLVLRGARNIVLSSRTGIHNGFQSYRINQWRSYGVNVIISTADISQESEVKEILEVANSLGPVAGIFNLTLILKDDFFSNQTEESFKIVTDPKATATSHLDRISRKICPYLEHFVMFSSVAGCYGNAETTNYSFANSVMERICEARHADNLPALAIQWGVIGEVGMVFEMSPSANIAGFAPQKIKSCLETLNFFMKQKHPVVNSKVMAEKRKLDSDVISTVANALGIKDLKSISLTWTLPELGLDSILALELKQFLEGEFNIFLTPKDLRSMTFAKLYQLQVEKENASNSAQKGTTQSKFVTNEDVSNQSILRIPFVDGKIQQQLPINEISTIFLFPGIEGLALAMEPLAKNLPVQVLCFQYHSVETENYIQKLIDNFSSYMLETVQPEQEFYFIGYSFGATIAVEVAKILEKEGRKGYIWVIDGSPMALHLANKKKLEEKAMLDDATIQNQVCIGIMQSFIPELSTEVYTEHIEKAENWESKKKLCFSMLSGVVKNGNPMDRLFDRLYHMLKAEYHTSDLLLHSPCVLIRCVKNLLDLPLDDDYGLTEHFKNPVEVYKIEDVDHSTIISHPKTAEIIMKSLPRKKE